MIVFNFKTDQDFKKAQDALTSAVDKIQTPHFDHSVQPAEKTITVIEEKNANIVEGLFKQNKIEYTKREDMSWIGPKKACISNALRQISISVPARKSLTLSQSIRCASMFLVAGKLQKDIDKAKKQQDKPSVFLGGSCDDDNAWREEIKNEFGDSYFFVDPYDPDWDPEENIYEELGAILNVDHVIFYNGGEGTKKEKKFMDNADKDYKDFDDLDDLKDHLKSMAEHVTVKKAFKKPSIFQGTIYRLPKKEELIELNSCNLSADQVYEGFCYTIVGRGMMHEEQKNMINKSIQMLCGMFPENKEYKKALNKAKDISLHRHR